MGDIGKLEVTEVKCIFPFSFLSHMSRKFDKRQGLVVCVCVYFHVGYFPTALSSLEVGTLSRQTMLNKFLSLNKKHKMFVS